MSLYTPRHFASEHAEEVLALIGDYPFATLVTVPAAGGEPQISHLPLLLEGSGEQARLSGHMARANPHWQAFATGHSTAIFHGPHAYISPRWYVNPAREVPTWNYATVHVHGPVTLVETAAEQLAQVDATTATFEPTQNPWQRVVEGPRLDALLGAIVAFEMPLARIDAKFKLNQNRSPADRAKVIAELRTQNHPDLTAMADWMQRHDEKP